MARPRSVVYPISSRPFLSDRLVSTRLGRIVPGYCTVCGRLTAFKVSSWNLRETVTCFHCRSFNRQRQIAEVVCRGFDTRLRIRSLAALRKLASFRVCNTESHRAVHNVLSRLPGYECSEYVGPGHAPGEVVNGVRHEDLQRVSYEDGSFDLVLSGDVFEHVPDPYAAHREVFRILQPGGRHVFTVPFYQDSYRDEVRARLTASGEPQFLLEPLYHSDPVHPDEGALVYTLFGLEMLVKLNDLGFEVRFHRLHNPWHGIFGPNALVFEAIKPARASST